MATHKQKLVADLAKALVSYGYKVYLAKGGTHGFYTDGKRVVSFQYDLGGLRYSGNYSTSQPSQTGTGWVLGDHMVIGADTARRFIEANAPRWAVGTAEVHYSTPEVYLRTYGASSGFVEFTG